MRSTRTGQVVQGVDVETFLVAALRPLVAFIVLGLVLWLCDAIHRKMPDGRLKRLLFRPLPGHRQRGRWGG
jgi:hypothetical protein